jgi:glycosyltransferase involved in cell wall biosynthesis
VTSGASVSVVIATFDRPVEAVAAVERVLAQGAVDAHVIIVDDGSTVPVGNVVAEDADRVRVLRQDNAGPSAARNAGARIAPDDVLVFVDDDDIPGAGWLAALVAPLSDASCGLSRCYAAGVDHLSFVPGTFAVRKDVFDAAGGYDERLREAEGGELGLRLRKECESRGLHVAVVDEVLIDRPKSGARALARTDLRYDAVKLIVDTHGADLPAEVRSRFLAIAGVSAARLQRWRDARGSFRAAIRARPAAPRNYARLALACVPALARRVWKPVPTRT